MSVHLGAICMGKAKEWTPFLRRIFVESLVRNHIHHITKLEFLPAFKAAFYESMTKDNICASFRGAGLVPFNPEAVLSKLDVKLRTPSPPATEVAQWESKTPSNAAELGAQSTLIRDRI